MIVDDPKDLAGALLIGKLIRLFRGCDSVEANLRKYKKSNWKEEADVLLEVTKLLKELAHAALLDHDKLLNNWQEEAVARVIRTARSMAIERLQKYLLAQETELLQRMSHCYRWGDKSCPDYPTACWDKDKCIVIRKEHGE